MHKQINKRGFQWFKMFSKKQKKYYIQNILNSKNKDLNKEKYIEYLKNQSCDIYFFIYAAFYTRDTPQGYMYWRRLVDRLTND